MLSRRTSRCRFAPPFPRPDMASAPVPSLPSFFFGRHPLASPSLEQICVGFLLGTMALGLLLWMTVIASLGCAHGAYNPPDNYLIDCGSSVNVTVDSRAFAADRPSSWSLTTSQDILASTTSNAVSSFDNSALYQTARVFTSTSSYSFPIQRRGRHWIRLYFFPFTYQGSNLTAAKFSVSTQGFVLLSDFQAPDTSAAIFKEYSVNITSGNLALTFTPSGNSIAFVNAIEVVSVPDDLLTDNVQSVNPAGGFPGIPEMALETVYRVNMGGPLITPWNDTLSRRWVPDQSYLLEKNLAKSVVRGTPVKYVAGGPTQETAPDAVYGTAIEMNTAGVSNAKFNVTWEFPVDAKYMHFVRFHFCDIVSASLNQLYFNVYINSWAVARDLDLSKLLINTLAAPYIMDFVVGITDGSGKVRISIGPSTDVQGIDPNAILNGLEIMKLNNSFGSLAGQVSATVLPSAGSKKSTGLILGSAFGALTVVVVAVALFIVLRRRKLAKKRHSKTWVPFSMNGGISHSSGSKFSNGTLTTITSGQNTIFSFRFPFVVIQEATDNFDENWVIGVGGFGKVYKGLLKDETKVAVKRGNPRSQQGLNEFRTEIELLSRLRHRHLVSLIGYCDEQNEMILVYEYMENGTLKSHLYGSDLPILSWKQRLEICIGAARGLHYLHTGQAKAIIHRDVKSANILLDENFMAKVADFGLSKTGPELDQTHVSTAVKGSFGYLDPEYFRRQQLTEKSDVYSFGVVLLEVLCARPVIDPTLPREMVNLAEWAMKWQRKGQLEQIIDSRIAGTIRADSLRKFGETVEKCLADYGVDRPSMGDVLWNLEYVLQLQEVPTGDMDVDSVNRIAEIPSRVQNVSNLEDVAAAGFENASRDDLSGVSMSRVFSQLVKAEGR